MITYTQRSTEDFFPGSENKPSLLESNFEYQAFTNLKKEKGRERKIFRKWCLCTVLVGN